MLDRFHVGVADVPVVICRGTFVLKNPTNGELANCLGFNESVDQTHPRDLVIVAPGRRGSPPRSTARLRDSTCS